MIEVGGLDRRETLRGAETCLAVIMRAEADQLALAAHWADLQHPDSLPPATTQFEVRRRRLDGDYAIQPGGQGTPEVLASCPAELGLVLQTSSGAAKHLIADALDLRHRLPRLWSEVQQGRVRAWKARKVAQATRHLPQAVLGQVDAGLSGLLSSLAWTRFEAVLDATVLRADPAGARLAEAEAAARRFVTLGRDRAHGLTTLIARGEVLDILTFLAAVNRIADLLATNGDPDSIDVRRSKAVGILGQPDRALALLSAHQHDHDQPPAPATPPERGGWRRPSTPPGTTRETKPEQEPEPEQTEAEPGETSPTADRDDHLRRAPCDEDEPLSPQNQPLENEPAQAGGRSIGLTQPDTTPAADTTAQIRVRLYVHLTDAALSGTDPATVCRVEGVGPVTATTVRRWLQRPDARITVRPVTVPGNAIPVDGYEIPHSVREAVLLRNPASAYPWSWCTDRTNLQLDHVQPYLAPTRGGPPGQTDPRQLAPLVGPEHQRKTSRRWQERTPAPGVYLWRSPHRWITLVTNQGTFPLGTYPTAQAIWDAAAPSASGRAHPVHAGSQVA